MLNSLLLSLSGHRPAPPPILDQVLRGHVPDRPPIAPILVALPGTAPSQAAGPGMASPPSAVARAKQEDWGWSSRFQALTTKSSKCQSVLPA